MSLSRFPLDEFTRFFHESEKPPGEEKFGFELELLGFHKGTSNRVEYPVLKRLLEKFRDTSQWEVHEESGNLTELLRAGEKISLEPGGQFEYSTPPLRKVSELIEYLEKFRANLKSFSESENLTWLTIGYDPFHSPQEMPKMPKKRYSIMRHMLQPLGEKTLHMMHGTCGTQVSIDYESEADMHKKLVVAQALGPVFTLLFANSAVENGLVTSSDSVRQDTWNYFDPLRTGLIRESFEPNFGYEDYARFMLETPMFLIERNHELLDCRSLPFRKFLEIGLDEHSYQPEDWKSHLRSAFFFTRLKNVIELRTVDSTNVPLCKTLITLICGILYNPDSLSRAFDYAMDLGYERILEFSDQVCTKGFESKSGKDSIADVAEKFLSFFEGCGSRDQSFGDIEEALRPVTQILKTGKNGSALIREKSPEKPDPQTLMEIYSDLGFVFI